MTLPPTGDDTFGKNVAAPKACGFDRTGRIYSSFVDMTSAGLYGYGSFWWDDPPDASNLNNSGPSYSRADAGCWSGTIAAHDLMHNLGAVQTSAPPSSGGSHCVDEYDLMCYSDPPRYPAMQMLCPPDHQVRFDCGHDDYFHPNPAPGSYLARHWNPANSRFLVGGTTPAPKKPKPKSHHRR